MFDDGFLEIDIVELGAGQFGITQDGVLHNGIGEGGADEFRPGELCFRQNGSGEVRAHQV